MANDKKKQKAELKRKKKELKAMSKSGSVGVGEKRSSWFVRFAEGTRGIIYIITGISIIVAIVLGQGGVIITLNDIINNLLIANAGKILLAVIALALVVYGLKNLRWLK